MAIANPLLTTALTQGATTTSLAKTEDGQYLYWSGSDPVTVTIKAATPGSARVVLRITMKKNYGLLDAPSSAPSGSLSATFELSAKRGADVADAGIQSFMTEIASLIATPTLQAALIAGSYV